MLKNLNFTFRMIALAIFLIGAYQSLDKYFQYPVVIQESSIRSSMIEKPFLQVGRMLLHLATPGIHIFWLAQYQIQPETELFE